MREELARVHAEDTKRLLDQVASLFILFCRAVLLVHLQPMCNMQHQQERDTFEKRLAQYKEQCDSEVAKERTRLISEAKATEERRQQAMQAAQRDAQQRVDDLQSRFDSERRQTHVSSNALRFRS